MPNLSEITSAIKLPCTSRGVIRIEPDGVGRPLAANLSYFRQAQPPDPLALQFGRHGHRK